jgi:hypothetical protein
MRYEEIKGQIPGKAAPAEQSAPEEAGGLLAGIRCGARKKRSVADFTSSEEDRAESGLVLD